MKSFYSTMFVATSMLAAACGGSDLDPGAGDDPGTGTSTLTVEGSISAEARLSNARNAADFDTEFSVRIELAGQQVTTGDVTVTSAGGTVALQYDPQNNNGRWRGSAPGYDEVYILDVISGADEVTGVRVDGPDPHVFSAPLPGATVDATMPLDVAWSRGDVADSTSIRAGELDAIAIDDRASYSLAPGALKSKKDEAQENEIRLRRTNRTIPAGAVGGSEVSVSIENHITVVAQPNPTL
jgi:hypothetical protein